MALTLSQIRKRHRERVDGRIIGFAQWSALPRPYRRIVRLLMTLESRGAFDGWDWAGMARRSVGVGYGRAGR